MGLMHSGHCSAPRTIEPPLLEPVVGLADGPLEGFAPPQATATSPATAVTAMARIRIDVRMKFLLSRASAGAAHPLRPVSGRYFRVRQWSGRAGAVPWATVPWTTLLAPAGGPEPFESGACPG